MYNELTLEDKKQLYDRIFSIGNFNTKKLNEIIEEEKSFKITAPEPIEIDNLVILNVKERSVIPPNFYKKKKY